MGIRSIPKPTGISDPQLAQWAAQVVDTINPTLRDVLVAGAFRWKEIDGQNGAGPTFALQVAQRGVSWTTVATFDATGQLVQPAWQAPTLVNSWAAFGGGNLAPGFMRDSLGRVHLRGTISGGTVGAVAFTLPAGYRPSATANFACPSNSAFGYAFVKSTGEVVINSGSNVWFALDGISFDTR